MHASHDPTYPLFPVLSFLGFVVALIPLPWHLQAWNSGTCAFMIWMSLSCLVEFINSLIWSGNIDDNLPVWCDISTKFLLGAGVGITASSLCISRRLYSIATTQNTSITRADKRRALIIDLLIAVGIPVLVMALHYVVQPHRYDILEDIGCQPAIYNTLPAYFLVFMWPILLGAISFVYSALTFRAFWMRRLQFAQLVSTNSSLSIGRYVRLMMLAVTDMALTVPLGIFSVVFGTQGVGLAPWISWEDTHFNFSHVIQVPAEFWRTSPSYQVSVELTRWLFVASAFIFFGLFGFAGEAQRNYKLAFWKSVKPLGWTPSTTKKSEIVSLPSWRKAADSKNVSISDPVFLGKNSQNLSGKASTTFSVASSTDATVRVDIDIEKFADQPTPSTPAPAYVYPPPSSCYSYTITTDVSPSSSATPHDPHWPVHR